MAEETKQQLRNLLAKSDLGQQTKVLVEESTNFLKNYNQKQTKTKKIKFRYNNFKRAQNESTTLNINEVVVVNAGTAMSSGTIRSVKKDEIEIDLKRPFCIATGEKIGISKRLGSKWALAGYGETI